MSGILQTLIASYQGKNPVWNGLISYHKLDGNSNDSLGTYNGTDTSITYVSGKIGNSASGNGSTSFISTGTPINGGIFSVSCWLKMNVDISASQWLFFSQRNNTSKTGYFISYEYNGGARRVGFARQKPNVSSDIVYTTQTLGTANWNHFCLTYNGTNVTGYFNGTSIGTVASSGGGMGTFTTGVNLLRDIESGTFHTNGIIDEVGQWNRILSSTEVTTLYNSGSGLTY